ncbi:MAG: hypothetical protein IKJ43_04505 [Bacilli bacterium]|nr:hypothetical protein [Bacilli bacterium]
MKIIVDDDITIFLCKDYVKRIDINNKESIENFIKKINDNYSINLEGCLDINIYRDIYYGLIINIKKDFDYFDYFKNDIEMNIKIEDSIFLYKIENIDKYLLDNMTIYKDKENIYIKPNSKIFLGKIIENSKVIYGDMAKRIIKTSKIINTEVII